jgi:hypothetical protein
MRKIVLLYITLITITVSAQDAFKQGEKLKYRLSYSKFLGAGNATMEIKKTTKNGTSALHVVGKGKTTGVISWFFKVRDTYETYFFKENNLAPYRFKRDINEGGYTKNKEIYFDQDEGSALVLNYKKDTRKTYATNGRVQDLLSSLYYMRNKDISDFTAGEEIVLDVFFDEEVMKMKLRFLGRETIKTKFGKIKAAKFMPLVQAGRVFKEKESVTVWVSDDENKIPLQIKASLAVGSLRADLSEYKGLKHIINFE